MAYNSAVSCIDSRANPYDIFTAPRFSIIALRNVGGRFGPAASDIAALDSVFHVSNIVLLHHSNCGASHQTKPGCLETVKSKRPGVSDEELAVLEAKLPFHNDDKMSLKEDLEKVRNCKFLREDLTAGVTALWLDVQTGLVEEVK